MGGDYDRTQARVYSVTSGWREWPRLTEGVYGHSCVLLGDKILLAGGREANGKDTVRPVIIDTKTGSAREVASLKYPRAWAAMEVIGGKAVILGGYDGSGYRSDGEMWNMDTETWAEADIELNVARYGYSLVNLA